MSSIRNPELTTTADWFVDANITSHIEKDFPGHSNSIMSLVPLPDGRLVSGSDDGTLKLWNLKTGECEVMLIGHGAPVTTLLLLPDGRVVSGSDDDTLKLWNLKTGECEVKLTGHSDAVTSLDDAGKNQRTASMSPASTATATQPANSTRAIMESLTKDLAALRISWSSQAPQDILATYDDLLQKNPKHATAYYERGSFYQQASEKVDATSTGKQVLLMKAVEDYKRAVQLDSFDDKADASLAQAKAVLNTLQLQTQQPTQKLQAASTPAGNTQPQLTPEQQKKVEELKAQKLAQFIANQKVTQASSSGNSQANAASSNNNAKGNRK